MALTANSLAATPRRARPMRVNAILAPDQNSV
jgi:hypothetical protein